MVCCNATTVPHSDRMAITAQVGADRRRAVASGWGTVSVATCSSNSEAVLRRDDGVWEAGPDRQLAGSPRAARAVSSSRLR